MSSFTTMTSDMLTWRAFNRYFNGDRVHQLISPLEIIVNNSYDSNWIWPVWLSKYYDHNWQAWEPWRSW
jgi:hypothetical protein